MKPIIIPNWTYLPEYNKEKKQILAVIDSALSGGILILGKQVKLFEKAFARFCGATYAIGVNSGTDAIVLSLKALGVGPGDEVITVPNSAIPTASAILAVGATPVFIDVVYDTLLMDPTKIESAITKRTKVIVPVHLYGQCCDMDAIITIAKKHHLFVLEDCAQAAGAEYKFTANSSQFTEKNSKKKAIIQATQWKTVGSMGDIAAFSFYPTKIIGAYGDGGAIVTNNKKLADTVRMLRVYGTKGKYYSYIPGFNSRLDEIQAAILLYKLKKTKKEIIMRQTIAKRYNQLLKDTPLRLPDVDSRASHVWHLYVVRSKKRNIIVRFLKKYGIGIKIHYPYPLHTMKGFANLGYTQGDFPVTEKVSREVFSLPMYPQLTISQQKRIVNTIREYFHLSSKGG